MCESVKVIRYIVVEFEVNVRERISADDLLAVFLLAVVYYGEGGDGDEFHPRASDACRECEPVLYDWSCDMHIAGEQSY